MKYFTMRILALLLTLAALFTLVPITVFASDEASEDLWDEIIAFEEAQLLRKTRTPGAEVTAADYAALSGTVAQMVMDSADYLPGTCTYDGTNALFSGKTLKEFHRSTRLICAQP